MPRFLRRTLLCAVLLGLAQCSGWLPPFETVPPTATSGGDSDAVRVAVCYNRFTASPEQLLDVATASCGPGATPPKPLGRDVTLNFCPLLTPSRATFACAAP